MAEDKANLRYLFGSRDCFLTPTLRAFVKSKFGIILLSVLVRVLRARNWYIQGKGAKIARYATAFSVRVCQRSGMKGIAITVLTVE